MFTNNLRKPYGLWDNVAKYGTARRATDGLRETCGAERKRVSGDTRGVQNEELHVNCTAYAAARYSGILHRTTG